MVRLRIMSDSNNKNNNNSNNTDDNDNINKISPNNNNNTNNNNEENNNNNDSTLDNIPNPGNNYVNPVLNDMASHNLRRIASRLPVSASAPIISPVINSPTLTNINEGMTISQSNLIFLVEPDDIDTDTNARSEQATVPKLTASSHETELQASVKREDIDVNIITIDKGVHTNISHKNENLIVTTEVVADGCGWDSDDITVSDSGGPKVDVDKTNDAQMLDDNVQEENSKSRASRKRVI